MWRKKGLIWASLNKLDTEMHLRRGEGQRLAGHYETLSFDVNHFLEHWRNDFHEVRTMPRSKTLPIAPWRKYLGSPTATRRIRQLEIILGLWFVTITRNENGTVTNGISVLLIFIVLRMRWELFFKDQAPLYEKPHHSNLNQIEGKFIFVQCFRSILILLKNSEQIVTETF